VAREEGFFNLHRRTIEKKLRERGLQQCKLTKKLNLTDIQKAQRYEIALSREHWTLDDWRLVILLKPEVWYGFGPIFHRLIEPVISFIEDHEDHEDQ
jgi:hypothetical protein